ncbi:UDP-4-amino-4,6-dideoxy-N-acetyl-beta-L-altrosamine N-acetyltransferase [Lacimicrobium alkaliphilum]|uniref:N-acetyltransferase domain-containing protein n=1 Tax=Lacimicrobium alkaliphilum TaxID=1526571 RepID=A0ABQ1RM16_9ALTE|nr:UDP-4-amino-4,6-dideoxy-N-acetyl-beta-L-altrosamine N-acetyltransferase [Lacimicrobium alkaliphilum]GGD72431.1 hypothetical protein GCM10011357_29300 [Lacimicrobium alkaliphilum]
MVKSYPVTEFRLIEQDQLERVWQWRNQPHIRTNMHHPEPISWAEHQNWFRSLQQDNTRRFFVFYQDNRPIGVLNFSALDTDMPEWGCYLGESDIWPGSGLLLEVAALDYAAAFTTAEALYAEVLSFNLGVLKLHRLFEYEPLQSRKGGQREGQAFDVLRFRYALENWRCRRQKILSKLPAQIRAATDYISFKQESQ